MQKREKRTKKWRPRDIDTIKKRKVVKIKRKFCWHSLEKDYKKENYAAMLSLHCSVLLML